MKKLYQLTQEQNDFIIYCIGYTMGSKNLVDRIIKEVLDALMNPIEEKEKNETN